MKTVIIFWALTITTNVLAIPWATNDNKDPSGTNAKIIKREQPNLEKHEKHCFSQISKLDFIGKSYDVANIGRKKMSETEIVSYYEVRDFNKNGGYKILIQTRYYSCMYGTNPFDSHKPHKRKMLKLSSLPPGI